VRVGLVIYGSLETVSGGYLYDRKLVEYLRACGDTVEVISLPWRSYPRHLGDNFSPELQRRFRELRLDILLEDELNHPSLIWSRRGEKAYPVVSIVHHLRTSEQHPGWIKPFYRIVERAYLRSVDGFVFNSQATRIMVEDQMRITRPNIVAYPAGNAYPGAPSSGDVRARAFQPGPLRLLFLGNVIPRKGLHRLLEAIARLPGDVCQLSVVGRCDIDPRYSAQIVQRAGQPDLSGKVSLMGRLPDSWMPAVLASHQVVVVPSDYEGFGIVYLEGFAFGLPAIASAQGGAVELVEQDKTGYLVDPEDMAGLAEAVAQLAADRERLAYMSQAAQIRFAAHPTWEETGEKIRDFLVSFGT